MAENTTEKLQAEIAQLKKNQAEQAKLLKKQAEALKIAEANRPKDAPPIVELESGEKVLVMHAIVIRKEVDGKKVTLRLTRDELAQRPDLCKDLLANNSSAVKPALA